MCPSKVLAWEQRPPGNTCEEMKANLDAAIAADIAEVSPLPIYFPRRPPQHESYFWGPCCMCQTEEEVRS